MKKLLFYLTVSIFSISLNSCRPEETFSNENEISAKSELFLTKKIISKTSNNHYRQDSLHAKSDSTGSSSVSLEEEPKNIPPKK